MKLIILDKQEELNRLAGDEFLQAWFWGEILAKGGEEIERWGAEENRQVSAIVTLIRKPLFGGLFYWYAPRGPRGEKRGIEFLLLALKSRKDGAVFIRMEPEEKNILVGKKNIKKSLDLQPRKTIKLDLNQNLDDILKAMHQKTRYNIKLAEKKNVKIILGSPEDFSEFWRLMLITGNRDGFRLHGRKHYENLLKDSNIKLFLARHDGRIIAAGLFCFFGNQATYLHGASDNQSRSLMAPYLLQWEVIKRAQADGYKYYDFYGIDEKKWPGVTRFKLGFGGFIKEYPGTYDLVFRPALYIFYELLRKLRRIIK